MGIENKELYSIAHAGGCTFVLHRVKWEYNGKANTLRHLCCAATIAMKIRGGFKGENTAVVRLYYHMSHETPRLQSGSNIFKTVL